MCTSYLATREKTENTNCKLIPQWSLSQRTTVFAFSVPGKGTNAIWQAIRLARKRGDELGEGDQRPSYHTHHAACKFLSGKMKMPHQKVCFLPSPHALLTLVFTGPPFLARDIKEGSWELGAEKVLTSRRRCSS